MLASMQQRRDTAATWTSVNPVLGGGEIGIETDTDRAKVGDGSTAWTSLGYWSPSPPEVSWVNAVTQYGATTSGDSTAQIQAALLSFGTLGGWNGAGGVVYLPPGDYSTSKPLIIPAGVRLVGDGWATNIDLTIGSNCDIIQFASYNSSAQAAILGVSAASIKNAFYAGVERLQLHGDAFHTTVAGYHHGINITTNPLNSTAPGDPEFDPLPVVRDVWIKAVTGDGINHAGRSGALFERVYAAFCNGHSVVPSYDTTMVDCLAAFSGGGFYLNHGSTVGTGCKSYNHHDYTWVSGASYAPNSFGGNTAVATYTTGGVTTLYFCIAAVSSATPPPSDPAHWTAVSATAPYATGNGYYWDTNAGEHTWSAVDSQQNSKSSYYFHGPLSGTVSVHGTSDQPNFNNGQAAFNSANPGNYAAVTLDGCSGVMAFINAVGLGTSNNDAILSTELNSPGSNTLIATTDGSAGGGTTYLFSGGTPKFALVDGVLYSTGSTTVNGTLATAHNTLDDGSGNVVINGTLATARNTLDDGTGKAILNGNAKVNGTLVVDSGVFSTTPFISSEDGTTTSHGALVHVLGANGTEFGHYLLWYDATDPAYLGLAMALGSGHTFNGHPIIALGGYYNGLGIQGSTSGTGQPIFGALSSTQSGNGLNATAFTICDNNKVLTFKNTLDDGTGKASFAGAVDLNSNKITSLANGSAASDAAAFGQIPVIDATAADIQPLGTQAAGATGKVADAAHVHPRLTIFRQSASSVTPSATISTFGSAVTLNPDSGFTGYLPTSMTVVSSGLATETITIQTVTTYTDNTTNTQSALTTITTNATTGVSQSVIVGMLVGSDTRLVKSIAFSVKSSIGSSTASLTFNLIGINLP